MQSQGLEGQEAEEVHLRRDEMFERLGEAPGDSGYVPKMEIDGPCDWLGERLKAMKCAFWAGDCGLVPKSTLEVVGGVLKGNPSK